VVVNVTSNRIAMTKCRILLLQRTKSLWLVVVLGLYMHIAYVWAAEYTDDTEKRFQQFILKYNRTYASNSTEYAKRLAIFTVSSAGSVFTTSPKKWGQHTLLLSSKFLNALSDNFWHS